MNIKDYKLKRPRQGYNNEKERAFAKWSNVSDWEVFFKSQKIGNIWYTTSWGGEWGWDVDVTKHLEYDKTKRFAFYALANYHHRENK